MVESTIMESPFIETKAFKKAKEIVLKNNIVVIRGNSGDGKTRTAIQILDWLSKRDNRAKKLLELHELRDWNDTVGPKQNLAVFIDDIFGYGADKDIWQRKQKSLKSTFAGDVNVDSNVLIVTVKNDVYNRFVLASDACFQADNVIDLSTTDSLSQQEKKDLLDLDTPLSENCSPFSQQEKDDILKCAPELGFPQCCVLGKNLSFSHSERVEFFRKPYLFMKNALSNLDGGRCSALLYLFLCGGKLERDLDIYSDQIDKAKLQKAFEVKLFRDEKIPNLSNDIQKIEFVVESLACLLGSLVVTNVRNKKEDGQCFACEYYQFSHDSIKEIVALMYGEKTQTGFIENCSCESLCYITTSQKERNKIVVAADNKYMFKRLLRELESRQSKNYQCVASLDTWEDDQFLLRFLRWLDDEKVDKDFYLTWTTTDVEEYGSYHYYIHRGCWGDTFFPSFLVYVAHTNNLCLLNKLLQRTSEDHPQFQCALFGVVKTGHTDVLSKITELVTNPTVRAIGTQSSYSLICHINVLHEACLFERKEMIVTLTNKYPSLVQDICCDGKLPTLHVVVMTGNCSLYDNIETLILGEISREDRLQHLCKMLDALGKTVLCWSCSSGYHSNTMSLHLLHKYPELASVVDKDGRHSLHWIALRSEKDLLIKFHSHLLNYYKEKDINFDITTCVTGRGESVLDLAKKGVGNTESIREYLSQFWS